MRLLIAAEAEGIRERLEHLATGWGYTVVLAGNGNDAWRLLQYDDAPVLALIDSSLPGLNGPALCQRIRESAHASHMYLLLLVAITDRAGLIQGFEAGADDCVGIPFDPQELALRLRAGRRIVERQEELRRRALFDALTGAWSRGAILEFLERELVRTHSERSTLGIAMADLDQFKQINDVHGHQVGDEVLIAAVQRMTSAIRRYDLLGRHGGDEFLVLLPGCQRGDAENLAERLRNIVRAAPVATVAGPVPVTVSLGVMTSDPDTLQGAERLLQGVDQALYQAKQLGRDRVAIFSASA